MNGSDSTSDAQLRLVARKTGAGGLACDPDEIAAKRAADRADLAPRDQALAHLLDQALAPEAVVGDLDVDALTKRIIEQTQDQLPASNPNVLGRIGPGAPDSASALWSAVGSVAAVLMLGFLGWGHLTPLVGERSPTWRLTSLHALSSPGTPGTPGTPGSLGAPGSRGDVGTLEMAAGRNTAETGDDVPFVPEIIPADLALLDQLAMETAEPDTAQASVDRDMAELALEVEATLTRHETSNLVQSLDQELATLDLLLATELGPVF